MKCTRCGITNDRSGICRFCGNETGNETSRASDYQAIVDIVIDREIEQLRREVAFLVEQFKETSHPSIMKKLENAQERYKRLLQLK